MASVFSDLVILNGKAGSFWSCNNDTSRLLGHGQCWCSKAFSIEVFEYSHSHHQVHSECRQNHEPCDKNYMTLETRSVLLDSNLSFECLDPMKCIQFASCK